MKSRFGAGARGRRTPLSAAVALSLVGGAAVQAQPALEEVIVTAQKRTESLQDVPISVSAIGGEKLVEANITNLEALTTFIPNFSMNQSGISNNITIRGVSSGINPGFEQSTGMYVDGIYYGRGQLARAPLFDLERIEVLRGPQPILFGKNSIAGAVSMITAQPTREFDGSFTALYETEEQRQDYRLVLSGPISDTLSGRFSALWRDVEGPYRNNINGNREKQEEEMVLRGSLLWEPSDALSVAVKYERADFDDNGRNVELDQSIVREDLVGTGEGVDYITALNNFVGIANNVLGLDPPVVYNGDDGRLNRVRGGNGDFHDNQTDVFVLKVDYDLGGSTLTSTTGWLQYDFIQDCDCDFTGATVFNALQDEAFEQFSQELRLTSPGGETIDYIAGLFYQSSDLDFADSINVMENSLLRILNPAFSDIRTRRFANQESDMWAAFAQVTWNINDTLRLVLGGRYSEEDKSADKRQVHFGSDNVALPATDPSGQTPNVLWALNPLFGAFSIEPYDRIRGDRTEKEFNPLVTLQWDATDDIMLYATYVEGFKAGGFDIRSNGHPDPAVVNAQNLGRGLDVVGVFEFEDESAVSYEIGAKMRLGARAELNATWFFTEYTDLQTSQFDGVLGFNVTNAGEAEISGVELDGRWAIAEGLTLNGALAYLDFAYTDFLNNQCYFGQAVLEPGAVQPDGATCDATGKRKEYTPEWTGSLTLDYVRPLTASLELRTALDLMYSDSYTYNPTLDPRSTQDAFTKVNLRVALSEVSGRWELAFVGQNLTDEDVVIYGGEAPLAGTLTGGTGIGYYKFLDRPATYAVQGTYRF